MTQATPVHNGSFWFDSLDDFEPPGASEALPEHLDVAIIGAGFTGLWTAYYLKNQAPKLNVGIVEAQHVGFGASGRNGGWCMGTAEGNHNMLGQPELREQGIALERAMQDTLDEIGRVCQAENVDCHFDKGGTLTIARYPHEQKELREWVGHLHGLGFTENDFRWLDAEESSRRLAATPNLGAFYTSHCAAIQPARLARGLGDVVRGKGVRIYENTPVTQIEPGSLHTERGQVSAARILRATEGYAASIKGYSRAVMPIYTHVVATEPLPRELWDEVGLHKRETFGDPRNVTIYGQRTLDDRLVFGGCVDYYFGSRLIPRIRSTHPNFAKVERAMRTMLPMLDQVAVTHRWGGLLGVARGRHPFVHFSAETGLGAAGGYMGEGVAASNLAARILASLALDRQSPLAELAWHRPEPPANMPVEPLRWIGASAANLSGRLADRLEARSGQRSGILGGVLGRLLRI